MNHVLHPIAHEQKNRDLTITQLEGNGTGDLDTAKVQPFVVGVDLGGTKIRAGIATLAGKVLREQSLATSRNGTHVVDQIIDLVAALCAGIGAEVSQVGATGIGGAGVLADTDGTFEQAPNLSAIQGVAMHAQLEERLGHPVILENDVNVSALGELVAGHGQGRENFVFISAGTGIGMGIVANGRLVRGSNGAAGEIGYLPFGTDPLHPANHVRGPLEEATAGDTLAARYSSSTGESVDTKEVFARAERGDRAAIDVVDYEAHWIAHAIVAVNAVLAPGLVVLGGGIGAHPELLLRIAAWLERLGHPNITLCTSKLGHLAPVIGAISLAIDVVGANPKDTQS